MTLELRVPKEMKHVDYLGYKITDYRTTPKSNGEQLRSGILEFNEQEIGFAFAENILGLQVLIKGHEQLQAFEEVTNNDSFDMTTFINTLFEGAKAKEEIKKVQATTTDEVFQVTYLTSKLKYTGFSMIVQHKGLTEDNVQVVLMDLQPDAYKHASQIIIHELDKHDNVHQVIYTY